MGDAKKPEESEVAEPPEASEAAAEPSEEEAAPEPEPAPAAVAAEPPGDPKKEWPLALGIMVVIAFIAFAFVTLLRAE